MTSTPVRVLQKIGSRPAMAVVRHRVIQHQAAFAAGAGGFAATRTKLGALRPLLPLAVLFTVYWATSLASHLNIGHRHILPTYPVLFIAAG